VTDTVQQLQARIAALESELKVRDAERAERAATVARLEARIAWLEHRLFGSGRSEKLDRNQLLLELEQLQQQFETEKKLQKISYEREVAPAKQTPRALEDAFAKLPVDEVKVIEPAEVQAEPEKFEKISEERTFEVDVVPPKLFKREIVRPKYRRKDSPAQPPVVASAPARPVQGHASAGLLSWIVVSKLCDHLPLFRQSKMFARWGARISRQSMNDWFRITAQWFEPIWKLMDHELLAGDYLQVDETPIRCNDPDEQDGRCRQGYLWVKSRPGGNVVFHWRMGRQHAVVGEILKGFAGVLHADGYEAYPNYAAVTPRITYAACWVHARRKFFEAQAESPKLVRLVLRLIAKLYRLEAEWDERGVTADARTQLRQSRFARSLKWLRQIAINLRSRCLPRSGLGEAASYLINQWDALCAHLAHGRTKLDTNCVENAIRPSALGKKNWLFVGHPEAGQRMAVLYSIILSCIRHGKEPLAYMRDVLSRLPSLTNKDDLRPLLPSNWQQAHA
jgi:transposase